MKDFKLTDGGELSQFFAHQDDATLNDATQLLAIAVLWLDVMSCLFLLSSSVPFLAIGWCGGQSDIMMPLCNAVVTVGVAPATFVPAATVAIAAAVPAAALGLSST